MKTFVYETTYESVADDGAVKGEVELRFSYTYRPATPDHYDKSIGGPGGWSPGDPDELEIITVHVEQDDIAGRRYWLNITKVGLGAFGAFGTIDPAEWAMENHYDAMVERAMGPEQERAS